MRIRAFQGLRPAPERASKVASLPYDVVNTEEARELADGNPDSFLHVVRAEIDLPEGTDVYSDPVYQKAAENLGQLQSSGALVRESEPCLYLYQQQMGEHKQRGLTAVCHVSDYENNIIKKHEKTRKAKEDDRTKLNLALGAHPGPVFLTFKDKEAINQRMDEIAAGTPFCDFEAPDGVRHTVWRIPGGDDLVAAFAEVETAYVADGHHRSASAARVGKEKAAANPNHTGEEDYNWFLAVIFPASELKILPYNRVVADLNGLSADTFLERVKQVAKVTPDAKPDPDQTGKVSCYVDGHWFGLEFEKDASATPVEQLDVYQLQEKVLAPILDIDDPRTSERIDFVGGIRGTKELVRRVDSGAGVAFAMFPTTVEELMAIADAGEIMPPKSTWFEPKLRSGLFVHTF